MPPKKSAGAAKAKATSTTRASTRAPTKTPTSDTAVEEKKPVTKTASKASTKSTTTKKTKTPATKTAPAKKPATKAATKKPAPDVKPMANTAKKRKASEDSDDEEDGRANSSKRVKPAATAAPAASKARPTATPKARKPRVKSVINHAPTEPLNVYVFGEGAQGELGLGPAKNGLEVKRPRLNPLLDAEKVGVVAAGVGGMHSAVLTKDNKVLTWGVNDQGALGRDTNWEGGLRDMDDDNKSVSSDSDASESGVNPHESTPTEVNMAGLPENVVFTQVACTDSATFALTDDGQVYGWGTFRVSVSSSKSSSLCQTNRLPVKRRYLWLRHRSHDPVDTQTTTFSPKDH
jgi:regulator of chromosome condensation